MTGKQLLLFADRFLEVHVGQSLLKDPVTAIVELVANAWDAGATTVAIDWPSEEFGRPFRIEDDGHGMTNAEFLRRWFTLSYDRTEEQGAYAAFPADTGIAQKRLAFGRNGIGRHAMFCFGNSYTIKTWKDGEEITYGIRRGTRSPLELKLLGRAPRDGHGTAIQADRPLEVALTPDTARAEIGMRFLTDPRFSVAIDGETIDFDDLPAKQIDRIELDGGVAGPIVITVLDTRESDRTAKQHGVAWHVNGRLVGKCSWDGTGHERFLDGRRAEAKRFTFIVQADGLAQAVNADWSRFLSDSPVFQAANDQVQDAIRAKLIELTQEKRSATVRAVRQALDSTVSALTPLGRETWTSFVDQAIVVCPSLSERELTQLAGVLASLEVSRSQYGLIEQLHALKPDDLDDLHALLRDWTLRFAKIVLDEVEGRLRLVNEMSDKVSDPNAKEVQELQPLFKRGLWIFGPEFETIEYTSNAGMTTVIQKLFGSEQKGSLHRPDFAVLPDSSVGLYSYPAYDEEGGEVGIDRLVIVELKRPNVRISTDEKGQAWKYVKELYDKGHLQETSHVTCFVLGSHIDPNEGLKRTEKDNRVVIQPMLYDTALNRAKSRLLKLYDRVKDAPFLDDATLDTFLSDAAPEQRSLPLVTSLSNALAS
jgi:hypothetical protein